MSQVHAYTNCSDVSRFTTHVGASENDGLFAINGDIIGYTILDTRMSHLNTNDAFFEFWTAPCGSGSGNYC